MRAAFAFTAEEAPLATAIDAGTVDTALLPHDVVRDVQVRRALRAARPCPCCDAGRADQVAIATHNLRVAEFGERSYRVRVAAA